MVGLQYATLAGPQDPPKVNPGWILCCSGLCGTLLKWKNEMTSGKIVAKWWTPGVASMLSLVLVLTFKGGEVKVVIS